jgi:surface protein
MRTNALAICLLLMIGAVHAQSDFVTRWTFVEAANQIRFYAVTQGGAVNYTWSASPSGNSGSGSFTQTSEGAVIIDALTMDADDVVTLSMEPQYLRRFYIANGPDKDLLTDVVQWGSVAWTSMATAFMGCTNLNISATDLPDLSGASNMTYMFYECENLDGPANIGSWDVSTITNMFGMFYSATQFNRPLADWNTENVTDMSMMFHGSGFNRPIGSWNTGSVTMMLSMFNNSSFNQPIGSWNTENVLSMESMFDGSHFNQNIGGWTLHPNVAMGSMLDNALMDCANYSNTLIGWAASSTSVLGRYLGAAGRMYGPNAIASRNLLISNGWYMVDDMEVAGSVWYADADGDSLGNPVVSIQACGQPNGYVANANDCDDSDDAIGSDCLQWTGATDSDWGTASNWNPAQVPTSVDHVTIRSAPVNQPEVNALTATPAVCNRLTIDPGASLTVRPGKALTVSGNLNCNGTSTVQADATGIGSLITEGAITGAGTFQAEQYLLGAGDATPNGVFHYVSSPVAGATASAYDLASGNKLWRANETTQSYPQITNGATALNAGEGYVVRMGGIGTVGLSGSGFHTGAVELSGLTRTGTGPNAGYNLVGNPYPSSVSWDAATKNDVEPSIWYRTHDAGGNMTFDVYNFNVPGEATDNNYTGGPVTGIIPPGQAVWVRVVDGETSGSVGFSNAMRSHGSQSSIYKLAASDGSVRMRITGTSGSDVTIVHFNADAQDGHDAFDSHKMFGAASMPQMHTMVGSNAVAINGLFSSETTPMVDLELRIPEAGEYALTASSITLNEEVWLEDRLLNNFQHLNQNPVYGFTSTIAGNIPTRFALHFGQLVTGLRDRESFTHVYSFDKTVNITVSEDIVRGMVTIMDMAGRTLQSATLNGTHTLIPTDINMGVYLVRVETDRGVESKRLLIN